MAKLIYTLEGAFLGEFAIETERMTIGRRPDNDICIDNLAISGEHAVLTVGTNGATLEDLGSTNGTIVNGQAIKSQLLRHGDVIELGKYQLKYIDEHQLPGKPPAAVADYEKTMILRPPTPEPEPVAEPPAESIPDTLPVHLPSWARPPSFSTAAQAVSQAAVPIQPPVTIAVAELPLARIRVQSGANAGRELALSKAHTTIGRQGVQVAAIARRPQGYFLSHVEGVRRPLINGQPVGEEAVRLDDQDLIEISGVTMKFYFFEI